eukprot:Skav229095  [mRNA]  locus=scaffold92:205255:206065:- [translate_table: standard]
MNKSSCGAQDWIVALDANADMSQGFAHGFFPRMGSVQCAVARHTRNVRPVGAIWACGRLQSKSPAELPGPVFVTFNFRSESPLWRSVRARKEVADPPMTNAPRLSCASAFEDWLWARRSVETTWKLWCSDVETWLVQERLLQRFLSRVQEAQTIAWRGSAIPPKFQRKISNTKGPPDEQHAVRARVWGLAVQLDTSRRSSALQRCSTGAAKFKMFRVLASGLGLKKPRRTLSKIVVPLF